LIPLQRALTFTFFYVIIFIIIFYNTLLYLLFLINFMISPRILFYMPSFSGGGAERNSVLIANELTRLGYSVSIVVDNLAGPNIKILSDDVQKRELYGNTHLAHILSLRKYIKIFKPNIVFSRVGLSNIKALLATFLTIPWKNIVISYESLYDPVAKTGGRLAYMFSFLLTRIAGATIAVSEDVKYEIVSRFKASINRIYVLHNPVNLELIRSQALADKPLWLNNKKYILSAGRMIYQKDHVTLIRAFSLLSKKLNFHLVILGEGPKRKEIENLARDLGLCGRVHLPGYLENPFPIYQGADLFVLSSISEGFGNVLIEAMSLGIPVVSTNCPGGPKEILDNGKYGKLVPISAPNALADAILSTLANPIDPHILRLRANEFSVEYIAKSYLKLLSISP